MGYYSNWPVMKTVPITNSDSHSGVKLNPIDVELNDKSPSIFTRQYAATDKFGIKLYIPDTTLSNESL